MCSCNIILLIVLCYKYNDINVESYIIGKLAGFRKGLNRKVNLISTDLESELSKIVTKSSEKYNRHPNFVKGCYKLRGHSINPSSGTLKSNTTLLLDCLNKIDRFSLDSRGTGQVYCNEGDNSDQFTTGSLTLAKGILDDDTGQIDEEFLKLKTEPYKELNCADLLTEIEDVYDDPLSEFTNQLKCSEHDVRSSVIFLGWEYIPSIKCVCVYISLRLLKLVLSFRFRLTPGHKPLCIDNVKTDVYSEMKYMDIKNIRHSRITQSVLRNYENVTFCSIYPEIDFKTAGSMTDGRYTPNSILELNGDYRYKLNVLFNVLLDFGTNFEKIGDDNVSSADGVHKNFFINEDEEHVHYFDNPRIKMLRIHVDGVHKMSIPLLVYVDIGCNKWYLCNNQVPIEPVETKDIWYPWNHSYSKYNAKIIPKEYVNCGFISTDKLEFKDEDIDKIISTWLPLNREYKTKEYLSGDGSNVKNIIRIKRDYALSINVVTQ